ncbi:MAG: PTS sugar transporter subunit IIB [Bacillota bacterium]
MIKIVFVCLGGISTSFLEQKTNEAFQKARIETEILARSASNLDSIVEGMDVVLLAPQVSYIKDDLINECKKHNVLFAEIPFSVYGQMDGEGVMKIVMELLKNKK